MDAQPSAAVRKLALSRPPAWTAQASEALSTLRFAPHGHTLFAGDYSGGLRCLETRSGKTRWQVEAHALGTLWCAPHPTEPLIASGGQDGQVRLWEANKGTLVSVLGGEKRAWSEHGGWSADGKVLAGACGKKVWFWAVDGPLLGQSSELASSVLCLDWHPSKQELLTGSNGGVTVFGPQSVESIAKIPWGSAALSVKWSPDGRFIAAGNQDQTVHAWPAGTTDHLRMAGYATKVRELAWSSDSSRLWTGGGYNCISWDFRGAGPSGSAPQEFVAHSEWITAIAAHPTASELCATVAQDHFLFLWRSGSEDPVWVRALAQSPATHLCWHPNGELLATGNSGGEVNLWPVTGKK